MYARRATWEHRLAPVCDALFVLGDACDVSAFLAGSGMFWRAVGLRRLGFLSRRRRRGIERLGIVLPLCGVLLSLVLLRLRRLRLRSELRSAHRRIIAANDRLGWSSALAGRPVRHQQALDADAESEYDLLRAEADLHTTRTQLRSTLWEKIALWADSIFLTYETIAPDTEKETTEAWTGIVASAMRIARVWSHTRCSSCPAV